MMHFKILLCLVVLVAYLGQVVFSAATASDSNKYVDNILLVASKNNKVQEGVKLSDFDFKIKSDKLFLADISGKFSKGLMSGFNKIKRAGDCSAPKVTGGETTISCKLDFEGVNTKYEALVKGYNVVGSEKKIDYKNKIVKTTGQLDLAQSAGKPASLKRLYIEEIHTEAEFTDLGFNDERKRKFKSEVDKKTTAPMFDSLNKVYKAALEDVVKQSPLPKA